MTDDGGGSSAIDLDVFPDSMRFDLSARSFTGVTGSGSSRFNSEINFEIAPSATVVFDTEVNPAGMGSTDEDPGFWVNINLTGPDVDLEISEGIHSADLAAGSYTLEVSGGDVPWWGFGNSGTATIMVSGLPEPTSLGLFVAAAAVLTRRRASARLTAAR